MDVKVETGGRGRKSRVIPVKYRIRCDPTALDKRETPDLPPEPPPWPTDADGFLAYTEEERHGITAALDHVGARYDVVLEEPEVYHMLCDVQAAESAGREHRSWSKTDAGFAATTAAERDRIAAALERALVPYTIDTRTPDQAFLSQLEGRVTTRSAALAAMATGTLPPVLSDIADLNARVDEVTAAQAKMPDGRSGGASQSEKVSAGLLITVAAGCFLKGLDYLGEDRELTARALLTVAWFLLTVGLLLLPGLRAKWRWCGLPISISVVLGAIILFFGVLPSQPRGVPVAPSVVLRARDITDVSAAPDVVGTRSYANSPEAQPVEPEPEARVREAKEPPPAAPVIGPGATVSQQSSGDKSPNVIAGGDVTIEAARDPNEPIVFYEPNGAKHIQIGGTFSIDPTLRDTVFPTIRSLYENEQWRELVDTCEAEIEANPDWLTPYLFAGIGYVNLKDEPAATKRLEHFWKRSAQIRDYAEWRDAAGKMLEGLQNIRAATAE